MKLPISSSKVLSFVMPMKQLAYLVAFSGDSFSLKTSRAAGSFSWSAKKPIYVKSCSFCHQGSQIMEEARRGKSYLSGTTWEVYLCILTSREPVGVRDVWRALKLSSPSLAQYHLNKLMDLEVVSQTRRGKYVVEEKERVEALRSFVLLRGKLIPRLVFYGAFVSGVLLCYLVFWSFECNFRDLVVLAVSVFCIFAFFFEAYIQYRSLRVGIQKV